ncbi:unnamed protein product [Peniophora sp. CBMAI 1063]|nr:unnamed protein product [Peniophora sp. CBMAI 1063]
MVVVAFSASVRNPRERDLSNLDFLRTRLACELVSSDQHRPPILALVRVDLASTLGTGAPPAAMLQSMQALSLRRNRCYISRLPLEVLQECLSYLPFVFDEFTEIHRCDGENKAPQSREEFLQNIAESNGLAPGRRQVAHAGNDRLAPGNRPGVDVVRPLDEAHWRSPSLPKQCRSNCRVEYWNWLEVRRVSTVWQRAADGCPRFNARVALQSRQTATRSLSLSGTMPLCVYATLAAEQKEDFDFLAFVCQLLEDNMHRIMEINITAEPHSFILIRDTINRRRTFSLPAPLLERLEINALYKPGAWQAPLRLSDVFATKDVPRLRHVSVHGCNVLPRCSLFKASLTSLVVHGDGDHWTMYTQLAEMLSHLHQLEVLSLCVKNRSAHQTDPEVANTALVELPRLRTLRLEARPSLLAKILTYIKPPSTTETLIACRVEEGDDRELLRSVGGSFKERLGVSEMHYEDIMFHRNYDDGSTTLVFSQPIDDSGGEYGAFPSLISVKAISHSYDDFFQCSHFLRAARLVVPCRPAYVSIFVTHAGSTISRRGVEEWLWDICLGDMSTAVEVHLHDAAGHEFVRRLSGGGLPTTRFPNLQRLKLVGPHKRHNNRTANSASPPSLKYTAELVRALERLPRAHVLEMEGYTILPYDDKRLHALATKRGIELLYERVVDFDPFPGPSLRARLGITMAAFIQNPVSWLTVICCSCLERSWDGRCIGRQWERKPDLGVKQILPGNELSVYSKVLISLST